MGLVYGSLLSNTIIVSSIFAKRLVHYYRQDAAKRQTAGIKFTHRRKIGFFAPQGRRVALIHIKLGRFDGHVGPLSCAKFHLYRHREWECGPKISKISTFW